MVLPSSNTSRTAPPMNSSENRRRARRPALRDPILDIVSAFGRCPPSDQGQLIMVCRSDECGTTFTIQLNEQREAGIPSAGDGRRAVVAARIRSRRVDTGPGTPLVPDYWQAGIGAGAMARPSFLVMTIQHPSLLVSFTNAA